MPATTGPHSYRDFVDTQRSMYISDWDILDQLVRVNRSSPNDLARDELRENVLRLQLRDLERLGAVRQVGHDIYQSTDCGNDIHRDSESLSASSGLIEIRETVPEKFPPDNWCLSDFSSIDGETIKKTNLDIADDPASIYGWVRDSPKLTQQRIKNVSETDIHRIIREFPTYDPLPTQCAHWMRAFAGKHFFPDANHRTATNTIEYIIEQNEGPTGELLQPETADKLIQPSIDQAVLHSKYTRIFQSDIRFNTLWDRDELFHVWDRYFTRVLTRQIERRRPHNPPTETLGRILQEARSTLADLKKN